MGAWHRRGSAAAAACSQKVSLWLFICGLAALQWRPYHHNGHMGEDTTREHIQHAAQRAELQCGRHSHLLSLRFTSPFYLVDLPLHQTVSPTVVSVWVLMHLIIYYVSLYTLCLNHFAQFLFCANKNKIHPNISSFSSILSASCLGRK